MSSRSIQKLCQFEYGRWDITVFRYNPSSEVGILFCHKHNRKRKLYLPPLTEENRETWEATLEALPKYLRKIALKIVSDPSSFLKNLETNGGVVI